MIRNWFHVAEREEGESVKERPILFNAEMVRAILDGRKTQTRGPYKGVSPTFYPSASGGCWGLPIGAKQKAPLGTVGDRLWVKETFGFSRQCDDVNEQERVVVYKACEPLHLTDAGVDWLKRCNSGCLMQPNHYVGTPSRWTPSIHMPRWASRIDLEITRVWVERVQDITEEDAKAEGVIPDDYEGYEHPDNPTLSCAAHRYSFRDLWQSIYGTWDANPFVLAYEFRRIKP